MDILDIKIRLHTHCKAVVNDKVLQVQGLIKEAQYAANNESKSSMGDKYETGRAMMHLEQDKLSSQLSELIKQQQVLDSYSVNQTHERIQLGSLIATDQVWFYLSVSLGNMSLDDQMFLVISPVSPIGRMLIDKTPGEVISFNNKVYRIEQVC